MTTSTYVIVSGGVINNYTEIRNFLSDNYNYIAVDSGYSHCIHMNITPIAAIGDFDSLEKQHFKTLEYNKINVIKYPANKNMTDTEIAFNYAKDRGAEKITCIGFSGKRLDHTLANINIAFQFSKYIPISFIDDYNSIYILESELNIEKHFYNYISIVPFTEIVEIEKSTGLKYSLENRTIFKSSSLTISNQFTSDKAYIKIKKGKALIILSHD